jgi:hypothetical protein
MARFKILYDEPHEAEWFRGLHSAFRDAEDESITSAANQENVRSVLSYDRPDIILLADERPILVLEETVEVPSGHNVGQRFARIAAAAEARVPSIYFGPYVAKKHGGETAGPRYMNLRLFQAFEAMTEVTGAAITTINWPVDRRFEVRRDPDKDRDVKLYIEMFLDLFRSVNSRDLNRHILNSALHQRLVRERHEFAETRIRSPRQYDVPPESVAILGRRQFVENHNLPPNLFPGDIQEIVRYEVGMTYIRSDPYTGMGILYRYLYVVRNQDRALVLWFPNISYSDWQETAAKGNRKDIRLYRVSADAILFSDQLLLRGRF